MIAPLHYSKLEKNIFRSSYPSKNCHSFIETLGLRSMICLNPNELRDDLRLFCEKRNIRIFEIDVGYNQEPFVIMSPTKVMEAITQALDPANHPCLLFCTNGRLRTSCVVGCLRHVQGWALSCAVQEYEQFMQAEGGGQGAYDALFIETFAMSAPS